MKNTDKRAAKQMYMQKVLIGKRTIIGGFNAISGDTNNNGEISEMNKCWWTNKAS